MKKITVKDIIEQCNGNLVYGNSEIECNNFSRDTRTINSGDVYLGIKGEKFNGSNFYEDALKKRAKVCILQDVNIDKKVLEKYTDIAIIKVEDVVKALQQIAKYKRSLYNIPVIAVTGSVGKTSTKDIITSVVSVKYNTLKTEGNLNNHIGLPLTILRLKEEEAMVIEMGMNNLGEISLLTDITRPTIAVITNVGTAHIGNLGSRENILKAKLEILEALVPDGRVIINNDNDLLNKWNKENNKYKVVTFGIENTSDLTAYDINILQNKSTYSVNINNIKQTIEMPIPSTPFIYNSLCALCISNELDIPIEKAKDGIRTFELSKNRMEVEEVGEVTIINDCYNANYDSMKTGLEFLTNIQGKRKIAILGDMLELGEYSKELHRKVGEEVANNKIDILIAIGKESKNIAQAAREFGMNEENIYEYNSNIDGISKINNIKKPKDVILVKASNGMNFKEIIEKIKQ